MCILFALLDFGYKTIYNITIANKQQCIVYKMFPKPGFILFENLVELPVTIFLSIFAGLFVQLFLSRLRINILNGPFRTFIAASLLPICACSSASLIAGMRKVFDTKNTIIFLITDPLLNPFIILMSLNILGIEYCLARIAGVFLLSFSAAYFINFVQPRIALTEERGLQCTRKNTCTPGSMNLYEKGMRIFRGIIPFVLLGAGLSITFEILLGDPLDAMKGFLQSYISRTGIILLGIPLYICGGADILILKPLIHTGLPFGTALSFSLTASSVCIPSLLMVGRLLGKKFVFILTVYIVTFSFVYGEFINILF